MKTAKICWRLEATPHTPVASGGWGPGGGPAVGRRPRGCPRTRWRDYVEDLSWYSLDIPAEHLSFVEEGRGAWRLQLELQSPRPPRMSGSRKSMNEKNSRLFYVVKRKTATATIRISVNIFIFLLQARKTVENLRCATWKMLTHHQLS